MCGNNSGNKNRIIRNEIMRKMVNETDSKTKGNLKMETKTQGNYCTNIKNQKKVASFYIPFQRHVSFIFTMQNKAIVFYLRKKWNFVGFISDEVGHKSRY